MLSGQTPVQGPSAGAYQVNDLEETYTVAHKLWLYKLLEQTASDIDALNGETKKSETLHVEARERGLAVKEFTGQLDRAVKEAQKVQAQHVKEGAKTVVLATAYVAWKITKWTAIGTVFIILSPWT